MTRREREREEETEREIEREKKKGRKGNGKKRTPAKPTLVSEEVAAVCLHVWCVWCARERRQLGGRALSLFLRCCRGHVRNAAGSSPTNHRKGTNNNGGKDE